MNDEEAAEVDAAISRIREGLQAHGEAQSRERAVSFAERLAAYAQEEGVNVRLEEGEPLDQVEVNIDTETLRRLRKITEIVEDDLGIDAGNQKFTKLATTGTNVSSVAAIAVAAQGLLNASIMLNAEANEVESISTIGDEVLNQFYRALCVFLIECFLFQTPVNYRIAWRGTRMLNNRYLYRMREYAPNLYRYILSEVHYVIRGIGPAALRSVDHYTTYLVNITVQTVEVLDSQDAIDYLGLRSTVKEIIQTFQNFVEQAYELVTPDIQLNSLVSDVIQEIRSIISNLSISEQQLTSYQWYGQEFTSAE